MPEKLQAKRVSYIYSENMLLAGTKEDVIVLFIETSEHKPMERFNITVKEARQLREDLTKILDKLDEEIEDESS